MHGLFMEAMRWDDETMAVVDSRPGEMNPVSPLSLLFLDKTMASIISPAVLYCSSVTYFTLSSITCAELLSALFCLAPANDAHGASPEPRG